MRIYDLLMRIGLGAFKREVVRGRGQSLLKALFLSFDDVDWPRTVAYSLGNVGQIRLNVRGREPEGLIKPGEPYEATRDEIINRLRELRDPQTGEPVVEAIHRREEIYWGRSLDRAADILFIPTRMEYFGFGEYEFGSNQIIEPMKHGISGTHRLNGMMLMWGKPIRPGIKVQGASILDLAPTVLHLMGERVPGDMDGRVLCEALITEFANPELLEAHNSNETTFSSPETVEDELTESEAQLIAERLRNLGYVA
jgi:predicted AlkP superfamily phosphohydrolase/phosphomutase